ncbi:MAG: response regulator [Anaerolineales bacterium]
MSNAVERSILVIDFDILVRKLARKYLQQAGFGVLEAKDGTQGVRMAKQHAPDLVLCALQLPGVDGFDVLRALREDDKTTLLPIILLAAAPSENERRAGMEMGADDVLSKPLERTELLSAVNTQLLKHQKLLGMHKAQEARIERAKKRLSLVMAHELRTPLISITMSQDLLWLQLDDMTVEEQRELLAMMSTGTRRLKHLVEQMVLLTQVETGILSPETIAQNSDDLPLMEVLQASVSLAHQFIYRHTDIDVQVQDPDDGAEPRILCNSSSLQHALAELITNAISFSPEGGTVYITHHQTEDVVWLSVIDSGPGIPPDMLVVAMEDFGQIERDKDEQQGIGMGLPLAYRIIKAHGGTLELNPVPSGGTQAIVGLPL